MKHLFTLLSVLAFSFSELMAGGTCNIDSSNTQFLSPHPDSIPCVERNVPYATSIQMVVPDSIDLIDYGSPFSFVLYVDSVVLTGINGLPTGITDSVNPSPGTYFPGEFVCISISGTSADTAGRFPLTFLGNITAHGTPYPPIFDGDTTIDLAELQILSQGVLDVYIDVIEQGEACRSLWGGAVCVIDSSNTDFFSPRPDSIPCVERNLPYSQVIQITVPVSINLQDFGAPFPFILFVDSVVITGVNGLPNGITYDAIPSNGVFYGGARGCALLSGTTSDPADRYPITFNGTFTAHGTPFPPFFDGDTTIDFATLQGLSQGMFELFVDVIEQGDPCRATSVSDFAPDLNSLIKVYPNPNNGVFEFSLNAGRRINGEINVIDISGRKVFSQPIDVNGLYTTTIDLSRFAKGIYTLHLNTSEGVAHKNISVE